MNYSINYVSTFIICLCLFSMFIEVRLLKYFVYGIFKVSQSVHNDEEVPIGDDMDQV